VSRDPYYILEDIVRFAKRFSGWEGQLIERLPGDPRPLRPVYEFEEGLAFAALGLNQSYQEYRRRVAEPGTAAIPIGLRRAIDAIPEMIDARLCRWGWDFVLTPDGMKRIRERLEAHASTKKHPLLDAALSWRRGKNVALHRKADDLAGEAERLDIKPTMTPEEGERVTWDRHREWYMSPALAGAIPNVSIEEHEWLAGVVDELESLFRLLSPEQADLDAQDDRSEPSLSEDQRYLLIAALELAAFDSDSRKTAARIVDRAKGRFADPSNAKKALADLVGKGLLGSLTGAKGGYWLTREGRRRAERLASSQKGDAEPR
jgi:hypothetical protein